MSPTLHRVAGSIAAAAIFGAVLVGVAAPTFADGANRAVVLSQSTDVASGATLTVSGSGFDSTRGIYLMFCQQVGTSGTAEGRPTGSDCSSAQAWITNPGPGVPPSGTVAWTGEGAFEATIDVVATFGTVDCRATGTVCGIVTRNDHRESLYDQDTFTPVTFAPADGPEVPEEPVDPDAPAVSVTPTTGLDGAGDTVTVEGENIPSGQGVYVRFCQKAAGTIGTAAGRPGAGQCDGDGLWVTPTPPPGVELPTIADGAFSVELPVVGAFDGDSWIDCMSAGDCGVFVRRDHNGGAADYVLDSFTPLTFDPESEAPIDPEEPDQPEPNAVSIAASPSTDLVDGQTINVTGSGFVAGQGIYVQLCATPTGSLGTAAGRAASCYPEQDGEHVVWVTPIAANGTFSTPLTVAESFTDANGTDVDCTVDGACGIFVRRDHAGGTSDYSQDAFVPIAFGDGDPIVRQPATLSADRTSGLDPAGDEIVVEGADFRPGDPVWVALCDSSVANFAACDYDHAVEVTPAIEGTLASARALGEGSSARALGDAGTFSTTLSVRAAFGDTDCSAIDTCAVQTWSVSGSDPDAEATLAVTFDAAAEPADDAATSSGTLARTGWSPWPLAVTGLGLLALGAAFVLASRRHPADV